MNEEGGAGQGLNASSTAGARTMLMTPSTPMATKNVAMIGAKNAATPAVPRLSARNSRMRMTTVAGSTNGASSASTCLRPSSAARTEIAGVMMASPENSAAPATPIRSTIIVRLPSAICASAVSERMPPSPLLSANIRNSTYLAVTTMSSAQTISDTTPMTCVGSIPRPESCRSAVCSA